MGSSSMPIRSSAGRKAWASSSSWRRSRAHVFKRPLEELMKYANERVQFGAPIFVFPRVQRKIGRMVCRIMASRQLTFYAARTKDSGKRCDLEAGMAKLLGTKAAWEAADACVQIHGG